MSSRRTLIIADDHPLFRRGLVEVLAAEKTWEILGEAGDGEAALRLIETRQPGVAIVDIDMPRATGLEVAARVRERRLDTSVVVLTMHKSRAMLQGAMDAGVRGYVLKERAISDLLACINLVSEGGTFVSPGLGKEVEQVAPADDSSARRAIATLTPSERQVLALIAAGHTTREIASELGVSAKTIENHRTNICSKLEVHAVNALVRFASEHKALLQ